MIQRSKKRGTHKRDFVPICIEYAIHRNAEWGMLMLGESIFSLLIVPVDHDFKFIFVFILGTITVAMVILSAFACHVMLIIVQFSLTDVEC